MRLLSSGAPWDFVKMEQDHHVEELDLIRNTQDSRLQALYCLYAYFRDGQNKNWHSDELQCKRNMDIFVPTTESGLLGTPRDDLSSSGGSVGNCEKCGTNLHSGGKESCPWNTMSTSAAKQDANKFMRAMASSSSVTLAPVTLGQEQKETMVTSPLTTRRILLFCNFFTPSPTLAPSKVVSLPHILISIQCSGFIGSRGTTTGVLVLVSVLRLLHVTTTT